MDNQHLQLIIISAEKQIFKGSVWSVIIPGISGKFGIEPNHAPLISPLQKGEIVYKLENDKEESIEVNGGIVEVSQNIVTICIQ